MASDGSRSFKPLKPNLTNKNPYRALPANYPSMHSRFPIVPSKGYGQLSFDPGIDENGPTEGQHEEMTPESRRVWREFMLAAVGNAVTPPDDDPEGNAE
ncbi:MAG TPA: hypothetical protein VGF28_05150 [Thermoanaerobaculia bacterium]|jgi:hypothetical protein